MDLVRGTALAVYSGPLLGGGGLVTNLCRTLVRPVDCNPIGSSVHGVSQARILEWVPFPSPMDHILSELSTTTYQSRVALYGMARSFI